MTSHRGELHPLSLFWLERMGEYDRLQNLRRMSGPGYVYIVDGKPVVAAGLGRIQNRQFFAWSVMAPEVKADKRLMVHVTRQVREKLPSVCERVKAELIEAETLDEPSYCRWLERFGFKRVAIARYQLVKGAR